LLRVFVAFSMSGLAGHVDHATLQQDLATLQVDGPPAQPTEFSAARAQHHRQAQEQAEAQLALQRQGQPSGVVANPSPGDRLLERTGQHRMHTADLAGGQGLTVAAAALAQLRVEAVEGLRVQPTHGQVPESGTMRRLIWRR
jgi:hypothetical protein